MWSAMALRRSAAALRRPLRGPTPRDRPPQPPWLRPPPRRGSLPPAPSRAASSAAAAAPASPGLLARLGAGASARDRVRLLARAVRYGRIPFLVLSVYGLGYQQGVIDCTRDPAGKQDDVLATVLAEVGCSDRSEVRTALEGGWSGRRIPPTGPLGATEADRQFRRVALVGERVTAVVRDHVDSELTRVMEDRMAGLPPEVAADERGLYDALMRDEEFRMWTLAKQRMEGRWRYLLVESSVPNAFVSELLPQRIFVTTAMMDRYVRSDDEMALVLGHELSHLILGHVSDGITLDSLLRTVEILLLSVDPTEGALSLGVMTLLAVGRAALAAANSRESEAEADRMGIKIAAMACYDTRAGAEVFDRMRQDGEEGLEEQEGGGGAPGEGDRGRGLMSFLDTHPPSKDRYDYLVRASEEENAERYQRSHGCGSVRQMFRQAMSATKRSEGASASR